MEENTGFKFEGIPDKQNSEEGEGVSDLGRKDDNLDRFVEEIDHESYEDKSKNLHYES